MMAFIQRLARSLRSGRTVELSEDESTAFYVLMPMILNNQHKSINDLLSNSKFDVNFSRGRDQRTLLHISANCGAYESLCVLIKKGASVNKQDVSGCTPLHLAARNGHRKCLIRLLENKADVTVRSYDGLSMIHWLAVNGHAGLLQEVLTYIKDVNVEDSQGQTALHVASQNGHLSAVECLLNHGANIDKMNHYGWTPLHFACSHGQHATVNLLLSKGASLSVRCRDTEPIEPATSVADSKTEGAGSIMSTTRSSVSTTGSHSSIAGIQLRDSMQTKSPLELAVEGEYLELCDILTKYQPSLLVSLVDMVTELTIQEAALLKVMKYLCTCRRGPWPQILQLLAKQAMTVGQKLLSINSNIESHAPNLLRCVRLFSKLVALQPITDEQSVTMNNRWEHLQHMEALWRLLEDWLAVVRVDLENCEGSTASPQASCDTSLTVVSAPVDLEEDLSKHDRKDNTKNDGEESLPRAQSLVDQQGDILTEIVPRLCVVIEAFYIVCTCHTSDHSPSPRFLEFVSTYGDVLKGLIKRNPAVIFDHFHFLLDCPDLMKDFIHIIKAQPFEVRTKWFYDNLYADNSPDVSDQGMQNDMLVIDRGRLFQSSCSEVFKRDPQRLKRELALRFSGEEGMGEGVVREWFDVLSKEILNPDYALFTTSADGSTFQPNSHSAVNPDHLNYFRFAGLCLGMALYHKQLLSVYFTRSFYKHILGMPAHYTDVASIDPEYAKNLQWILDHDISSLGLDLTFSVETDVFGVMEERQLKPGGTNIPVTEQNKVEYVQLVTDLRMTQAIQPQINSFLSGFHVFVPHKLIQMFDEYELELMLSGIPEINIEDWKDHTTYIDCSLDSPVIKWFWEAVEGFNQQERVLLLQFVTGSSRLPYGGFSKLASTSGPQQFTISCVPYKENLLPTASTCVNYLKLPIYPTKEETVDRLSVALHCGSQGYSLA